MSGAELRKTVLSDRDRFADGSRIDMCTSDAGAEPVASDEKHGGNVVETSRLHRRISADTRGAGSTPSLSTPSLPAASFPQPCISIRKCQHEQTSRKLAGL
jgi:hypothetical protein